MAKHPKPQFADLDDDALNEAGGGVAFLPYLAYAAYAGAAAAPAAMVAAQNPAAAVRTGTQATELAYDAYNLATRDADWSSYSAMMNNESLPGNQEYSMSQPGLMNGQWQTLDGPSMSSPGQSYTQVYDDGSTLSSFPNGQTFATDAPMDMSTGSSGSPMATPSSGDSGMTTDTGGGGMPME